MLQWFANGRNDVSFTLPALQISSLPLVASVSIAFDFAATATEVLRSLAWLICRCSRFTSNHLVRTVRTWMVFYREILRQIHNACLFASWEWDCIITLHSSIMQGAGPSSSMQIVGFGGVEWNGIGFCTKLSKFLFARVQNGTSRKGLMWANLKKLHIGNFTHTTQLHSLFRKVFLSPVIVKNDGFSRSFRCPKFSWD